ncbi:MAG: sel1 repeat family protein [Prevotellaceae bacterium]|jgi:TPR repeat protein|nr:sel1 repeat family protein [Prevotellaceae bacterium]
MSFKQFYNKTVKEKKTKDLQTLAGEATEILNSLHVPEKWLEAMAICEVFCDAGKPDEKTVHELYEEMFLNEKEYRPGASLNSEDYAEWFAQFTTFCKKMAKTNPDAWALLGSFYLNARFDLKNETSAGKYLLKGMENGSLMAFALRGYYQHFKILKSQQNNDLDLIRHAIDNGFEKAEILMLIIQFSPNIEYKNQVENCITRFSLKTKPWFLLGDIYVKHECDFNKAIEIYEKGIDTQKNPYCMFKKAVCILNNMVKGDYDEALELMKYASDSNISDASLFLGQFYNFNNDYHNTELAIEYYKKAVEYNHAEAMYQLAMIYMYNPDCKNVDESVKYLDRAVICEHVDAMNEKATLLLESEIFAKNTAMAKKLLNKSLVKNDGYAAFRLGLGYQNAEFSKKNDYKTALKYYKIGAERSSIRSIEMLGHYYLNGIACKTDFKKAIKYYKTAIDHNSNYARVELALCYEDGLGVKQNYKKAFELLSVAADNNYTYAITKLGHYYMNGKVGSPDMEHAFECFSKAAENGDAEAMFNLGRIYKYAIGHPESPELAVKYFTQAAEYGIYDACIETALCYEQEYGGLDFDPQKIMQYMSFAAENGHPYALYKLGCYYWYGDGIVEQDREKAVKCLTESLNSGFAMAGLSLGDCFLYNENYDYDKAFEYYRNAAEKDYISEGIGICYLYGLGVEANETEGFKYLSIAAGRNYAAAKFRLGMCYKYGSGTGKNMTEAFKWLQEAAEDGYMLAEYETGMLLLKGEGIQADPEKGVKWLLKAAEKEMDSAQFELGNCYLMGLGVAEDEIQAMYWYQRAAENGNEQAQKITGKRNRKLK